MAEQIQGGLIMYEDMPDLPIEEQGEFDHAEDS
jgi:hypothetical protein